MNESNNYVITVSQSVAILIDGNNIEKSIHEIVKDDHAMLNFDSLIPKLLDNRGLNRLIYFREGRSISAKLAERLHSHYHGSVCPCHKSADIPLTIKATQLAPKVDTIIILSGDSDYIELVRHLKAEGVRVEIAAIEATTANILKEEADHFTPIVEEDWFIFNPYANRHSNRYSHRSSGRHLNISSAQNASQSAQSSQSGQGSTAPSGNPSSNSSSNPSKKLGTPKPKIRDRAKNKNRRGPNPNRPKNAVGNSWGQE